MKTKYHLVRLGTRFLYPDLWKIQMRKNYWVLFLGIFLSITCFSCRLDVRTRAILGGKLHVDVAIQENVNKNHPIAFDIVIVYDKSLLSRLLKLSAKDWFDQRSQITRDYPKEEGMNYWGWEWVPGQKVPMQVLPLKPNAVGLVMFADYVTPGAHRIHVDPFKDLSVRLMEKEFFVEPSPKN